MSRLYLASKSPQREMLLSKLTTDFKIIEVDINEAKKAGEPISEYLLRVSVAKAMAARQRLNKGIYILSADTEVVHNNKILGKPKTHKNAVDMLMSLSGQEHIVYTMVVLLTDKQNHVLSTNHVWFRTLNRNECEKYCYKYPPMDKTGAYGIQDFAAGFINRLEGSFSGVMGLPLRETKQLLLHANIF